MKGVTNPVNRPYVVEKGGINIEISSELKRAGKNVKALRGTEKIYERLKAMKQKAGFNNNRITYKGGPK